MHAAKGARLMSSLVLFCLVDTIAPPSQSARLGALSQSTFASLPHISQCTYGRAGKERQTGHVCVGGWGVSSKELWPLMASIPSGRRTF
mmetsp:Transcript_40736/g.101844  ORF Transcript_40736/g.101844 Transcript_40736/m.101844 type:complete len:89 (-) Transcript_40736:676-942(-)